jgi:phosphatidylserine/phosphatidylglycerophosphate/cardiolipin synthase-like enzyme
VKVQVVLDASAGATPGTTHNDKMVAYLKSHGVQVLTYPADTVNIDHVKLMVVDSKVALIGGMNWSSHAPINHDADVRITGPAVRKAEQIFDEDWAFSGGKPFSKTPADNVPSGNIKFITTSPPEENGGSNDIEATVLDDISRAQKSVHVEMYTFTDPHVIQALKDAHARGVDVKVILDPTEAAVNQATFDELSSAGIETRWYDADTSKHQMLHAKWAVFDDKELLIGSANWTHNGLFFDKSEPTTKRRSNHEADVDIQDAATASIFEKQFEDDWNNHTRAKA